MALLVLIGTRDAQTLAKLVSRSGTNLSTSKLEDVLTDARTLATATLEGSRDEVLEFQHGLNVDWLSEVFLETGCRSSAATASRAAPEHEVARTATKTASNFATDASPNMKALLGTLAAVAAISAAYASYKLYMSFYMRRRRVDRMPRFPILLPLDLTYTDHEGHIQEASVQALDISLGGLKLDWPEPAPPGTLVTLPLLAMQRLGRVSWSNTYFAGIMFDAPLTNQELKALKTDHQDL